MFGFGRKKSVKIVPFSEGRPHTFQEVLCDGVMLRNVTTLASLIPVLRDLQAAHPACKVLTSLDNLGQAGYTSGHCTDSHKLNDTEGHDLSNLDPAAFEDGETSGISLNPV